MQMTMDTLYYRHKYFMQEIMEYPNHENELFL